MLSGRSRFPIRSVSAEAREVARYAVHFVGSCWQRVRLQPERAGSDSRINAGIFPPCGFIATAMDLAMMAAAQRHGELIADLATECAVLREAQMMGI